MRSSSGLGRLNLPFLQLANDLYYSLLDKIDTIVIRFNTKIDYLDQRLEDFQTYLTRTRFVLDTFAPSRHDVFHGPGRDDFVKRIVKLLQWDEIWEVELKRSKNVSYHVT